MSQIAPARRLPTAVVGVVSAAFLLAGCAPAPDTARESEPMQSRTAVSQPTALMAASVPRGALFSDRHDTADIEFVRAALAQYRQSASLARMMRSQAEADSAYVEVADQLLSDQGGRVAVLETLLRLWGADRSGPVRQVDGKPGTPAPVDQNIALLAGQTDSSGFAPFWLMTVQAHQDDFIDAARTMRREATSSDVRRVAEAFCDDYADLDTALTSLGA